MAAPDNVTAITLLKLAIEKFDEPIAPEDLSEAHALLAQLGHRILASHHRGCDPYTRETINGLYRAWRMAAAAQASVEAIATHRPAGEG
jgi:hypothetical protein